jgi:hypothetical protein
MPRSAPRAMTPMTLLWLRPLDMVRAELRRVGYKLATAIFTIPDVSKCASTYTPIDASGDVTRHERRKREVWGDVVPWHSRRGGSHRGGHHWSGVTSERGNGVPTGYLPCCLRRLRARPTPGLSTMPKPDRDMQRWRLLLQRAPLFRWHMPRSRRRSNALDVGLRRSPAFRWQRCGHDQQTHEQGAATAGTRASAAGADRCLGSAGSRRSAAAHSRATGEARGAPRAGANQALGPPLIGQLAPPS